MSKKFKIFHLNPNRDETKFGTGRDTSRKPCPKPYLGQDMGHGCPDLALSVNTLISARWGLIE